MVWEHVATHLPLPAAVAVAAGFGAWRCWRLLRLARDPRLIKLMWFYALFAASLVSMTIWTAQIALNVGDALGGGHAGNISHTSNGAHEAFIEPYRASIFLLAAHGLMLASLGVAVRAFSHRRLESAAVAAISLVFFAEFIPVFLAAEAALTLYLAVQAILNHMARRTPGALQVAAGFSLFFLGHLSYFLLHSPGVARTPLGDILALVGIVLLVQLLPRPSA